MARTHRSTGGSGEPAGAGAHFLLPATPLYGHVRPMLALGAELMGRGHAVTVLTGRKYAEAIRAVGLAFAPLPREVDYDDADLEGWLPGWGRQRGLAAARHDILGMFVGPLAAQHRALDAALAAARYDAVVAETAFLGVLPLVLTVPAADRVPVVGVSVTPLSLTSVDCAHFGSGLGPVVSRHDRWRSRLVNAVLRHGPLKAVHEGLDAALKPYAVPPAALNYFDAVAQFDLAYHLATPGLEYPRRELPATVRCVGPLPPETSPATPPPDWWSDLDGERPVVHVTQGTMDNADPDKLLVPALKGLAGEDVLVVASTGGRPVTELRSRLGGQLPGNARVAEFLPYGALLPRIDAMVTNGGFGGVQQALAYGVPLVVAGATEDKPEVAARVAWSGSGLNLRTGWPSPSRLRRAIRAVLGEPRYRAAAVRLQTEIAALGDPVATIADALEATLATPARSAA